MLHLEKNFSKPILKVSCAILEKNGQVLAAQRRRPHPLGGLWEFPGGKIELGESAEESLMRELDEELGIGISIESALKPADTEEGSRVIRLYPFRCSFSAPFPFPREHLQIIWLHHSRLNSLEWAPADLPVLMNYLNYLAKNG